MAFAYYIALFFIVAYFYVTRHFNHWKNKKVPFIKPLPLFGNALNAFLMRQTLGELLHDLYNQTNEPVLGFFILDQPCLLIRDPLISKRILISDFQSFYDRSVMNNKRDDPISTNNLFVLKNPDWRNVRVKITPVYTTLKLKAMSQLMEEACGEMTEYVRMQTGKDGGVVEMKELSTRLGVNVITSTAFGVNALAFKGNSSRFLVEAKKLINWDNLMTSFRLRCYFLFHVLVKVFRMKMFDPGAVKFLEESFWHIVNEREVAKSRRNDLVDLLLQVRNDDKQSKLIEGDVLVAQVVTFFVAGFETTSGAISFAMYELAKHQDIQDKLRQEINAITKKYGFINYEALKEMTYLDLCVKETLRKYPVLPFLERRCMSKYTIPETGAVIEPGTSVFVSNYGLHHDAHYYPNPEVFDPERFSESEVDESCYLPFGAGPRSCIGLRFAIHTFKLAVANLIQDFVVTTCPETEEKIKFNPNGITLVSIDGVKLNFKHCKVL